MSPTAPHLVTRAELAAVGNALARAFATDPVWQWLLADTHRFQRRASHLMRAITQMHLSTDSVWTTEGTGACAVWAPPGKFRTPASQFVRVAHRFVPAAGLAGMRRFATVATLDDLHPSEPHWYLALLGTDPAHQGRGLGSAVMGPGMAAADAAGVGCYLESSKESNIAFYRRHGFDVIGTHDLDHGSGPRVWLMWRDPVPDANHGSPGYPPMFS